MQDHHQLTFIRLKLDQQQDWPKCDTCRQAPDLPLLVECKECSKTACPACLSDDHPSRRHPQHRVCIKQDTMIWCDVCYAYSEQGTTALYFRCDKCNFDECLQCFGAERPELCDEYKFWMACRDRDLESVQKLAGKGIVNRNWRHYDADKGPTGFWEACAQDNLEVVSYLVDLKEVSVDCKDAHGRTPFFIACQRQSIFVVMMLLMSKRPGLQYTTACGNGLEGPAAKMMTPWDALSEGSVGIIRRILQEKLGRFGADMILAQMVPKEMGGLGGVLQQFMQARREGDNEEKDEQQLKELQFWDACRSGDLEQVKKLVGQGVFNRAWKHPKSNAPTGFWVACATGKTEVVRYLVGVPEVELIDANDEGVTPLMVAHYNDHLEIVKLLLDSGRDLHIDVLNKTGACCLYAHSNDPTGKLLRDFANREPVPANLFERCSPDEKEMHFWLACATGRLPLVRRLATQGVRNLNWTNVGHKEHPSGMWIACYESQLQIVEYLCTLPDVDFSTQNSEGKTVLEHACSQGNEQLVELLLRSGRRLCSQAKMNLIEETASPAIQAIFAKFTQPKPDYPATIAQLEQRCRELTAEKLQLELRCEVLQSLDRLKPREYKDPRPALAPAPEPAPIVANQAVFCSDGLGVTKCPLCLESPLVEPRTLPCQHSACLSCLQDTRVTQCPLCNLPLNNTCDYQGLPCHHFVQSIAQHYQSTSEPVCSICSGDATDLWFCCTCAQKFCGQCRTVHDRITGNKLHQMLALEQPEAIPRVSTCQTHGAAFQYFCTVCRVLACSRCALEEHSDPEEHAIHGLEKHQAFAFEEMSMRLDAAQTRHDLLASKAATIRCVIDELETNYSEAFNQVLTCFGEAKRQLEVREEMHLSLLDKTRDARRKNLQLQLEQLEFLVQDLSATMEVSRILLRDATLQELAMDWLRLSNRLRTLTKTDFETEPVVQPHLGFFATAQDAFEEATNRLGKIVNA